MVLYFLSYWPIWGVFEASQKHKTVMRLIQQIWCFLTWFSFDVLFSSLKLSFFKCLGIQCVSLMPFTLFWCFISWSLLQSIILTSFDFLNIFHHFIIWYRSFWRSLIPSTCFGLTNLHFDHGRSIPIFNYKLIARNHGRFADTKYEIRE